MRTVTRRVHAMWPAKGEPVLRQMTVLVVLAGFWIAACGGGDSETSPPTPPPPPARAEPAEPAAPEPTDLSPSPVGQPTQRGDAFPVPDLELAAGDAAAGDASYQQYCASCHGADGRAETPMAKALNPQPANHADGAYMNALGDEHLFKVVKYGGSAVDRSPLMAPWGGTLSDEQIVDVIAFVRSLADPPYAP